MRAFSRPTESTSLERTAWELERRNWAIVQGDLMQQIDLERSNLERAKKELVLLQQAVSKLPKEVEKRVLVTDPIQRAKVSQLEKNLEEANLEIQMQQLQFTQSRQAMASQLDKEMAAKRSLTETIKAQESALIKVTVSAEEQAAKAAKTVFHESKAVALEQRVLAFEHERIALELSRKVHTCPRMR